MAHPPSFARRPLRIARAAVLVLLAVAACAPAPVTSKQVNDFVFLYAGQASLLRDGWQVSGVERAGGTIRITARWPGGTDRAAKDGIARIVCPNEGEVYDLLQGSQRITVRAVSPEGRELEAACDRP